MKIATTDAIPTSAQDIDWVLCEGETLADICSIDSSVPSAHRCEIALVLSLALGYVKRGLARYIDLGQMRFSQNPRARYSNIGSLGEICKRERVSSSLTWFLSCWEKRLPICKKVPKVSVKSLS